MKSTLLTTREKRCLQRAWTRREARLEKNFQHRHAYLKSRVRAMKERVEKNVGYINRLRSCLMEGIGTLLYSDDQTGDEDARDTADGPAEKGGEEETMSAAQLSRLYAQAVVVLEVLEEERTRDLLIEVHTNEAFRAIRMAHESPGTTARVKAAEHVAKKAMEEASLVRLDNSLLLIAERSAKRTMCKVTPETILSWTRQFRELGGHFKRDGRGVREREWILSEEDLSMELLGWLKVQKRVTTHSTHKFINETLLAREGGILKLAQYGLSLPISKTTTNVWMRKLGCKHDKVKQSYYTDGHERPDVQEARKLYVREQRKLALRKPCWMRVKWSSLTVEEQQAFEEQKETGPDMFSAETFHFEAGGNEYIEFHVDFLGAGSDERHDALRAGLGDEGGQYSIRFEQAAASPCEHFHAPEVCRCHQPLYHIGQDESVYKAYARESMEWVILGVRGLRKKSEGPGEMVSAFQDEKRGFGLTLSEDELARVNAFRETKGRPPLKETPGTRFLLPGKNREGYWGFADFEEQTIDVMDCLEVIEPGKQLAIEVDHSAGHAKYLPEGLHVANMNVKYGGKQKDLGDSVMTEGCLGTRAAEMYLYDDKWRSRRIPGRAPKKVVDLKLKLGEVQSMKFGANDPPPSTIGRPLRRT